MAKVGAQRAAELTGKSKSTIQRAMNSGKLSYELDGNGRRVIDVSELDRAFGLEQQQGAAPVHAPSVEEELQKASQLIEMERMKMTIKMLEEKLEVTNTQLEDLRGQRDQWQKQAAQVLITSQHSQKQADELREELKEREKRTQARRQQKLDERMKRMQAQNENQNAQTETQEQDESFNFQGLWKRVKGAKA